MFVLFLDIDGVLNSRVWLKNEGHKFAPDYRIDPEKVERLNDFTKRSGCKIVVSSAWRLGMPALGNMQVLLNLVHGVDADIIGMTPCLFSRGQTDRIRGDEIQAWLDEHPEFEVERFVILDDEEDMGELTPYLVRTSFENGLQDWHIERLLEKLKI